MKFMNESIKAMWSDYLNTIGEDLESVKKNYNVIRFGGDEKLAEELTQLIIKNKKRASTSLKDWYEFEGKELPKTGDLNIITDFNNAAKCIVETQKVSILPFCDVSETLAFSEGEMYESLEQWRAVHSQFFQNQLAERDKKFAENMIVVIHEFKVIYRR